MKCPGRADWVLFYYKDLEEKDLRSSVQHLDSCEACQKQYLEVKSLLSKISRDRITLKEEELERILAKIKLHPRPSFNMLDYLSERFDYFLRKIQQEFSYKPQVALATLILLIGLISVPLAMRNTRERFRIEMAEAELELTLEEDDEDNSDIFLDILSLDEFSQKVSSTIISS
jgi:hypothetical protein